MTYKIFLLMLANAHHGKDVIIKTKKKNYLAHLGENKSNKRMNHNLKYGFDYQNEPDWISNCSFKKRGEMVQQEIVGCGGGLDLKCTGGCLKIHKILYSCKEQKVSNAEQLQKVKSLCDKEEECSVQASRETFGNKECPDSPDSKMLMWIIYSCDGGEDRTKITGPKTCPTGIEKSCGKEGPMVQHDVVGCGGRIDMKCIGGCLKILKVLYELY